MKENKNDRIDEGKTLSTENENTSNKSDGDEKKMERNFDEDHEVSTVENLDQKDDKRTIKNKKGKRQKKIEGLVDLVRDHHDLLDESDIVISSGDDFLVIKDGSQLVGSSDINSMSSGIARTVKTILLENGLEQTHLSTSRRKVDERYNKSKLENVGNEISDHVGEEADSLEKRIESLFDRVRNSSSNSLLTVIESVELLDELTQTKEWGENSVNTFMSELNIKFIKATGDLQQNSKSVDSEDDARLNEYYQIIGLTDTLYINCDGTSLNSISGVVGAILNESESDIFLHTTNSAKSVIQRPIFDLEEFVTTCENQLANIEKVENEVVEDVIRTIKIGIVGAIDNEGYRSYVEHNSPELYSHNVKEGDERQSDLVRRINESRKRVKNLENVGDDRKDSVSEVNKKNTGITNKLFSCISNFENI